jgi:pimeloyl-ACP methyl ester carboxylesterase
MITYYHDVPPALAAEAMSRQRDHPSVTSMREDWPLSTWPDVPTRVLIGREDRFFPAPFLRRVCRERLGIVPDEIDSGHCVSLSRPKELAERLLSYLAP